MRLDISQRLHLEQCVVLAPRIIQAMEILQLPVLALQERIDAELQSNPVLETQYPGMDDEATPARIEEPEECGKQDLVVDDSSDKNEDFERLAEFEDEFGAEFARSDAPPWPRPTNIGERDPKLDAMANTAVPGQSLNEDLLEQWAFIEADEPVRQAGVVIINRIDAGAEALNE